MCRVTRPPPKQNSLATAAADAPADPYHIPHRKNAAEWVMWVALRPLVPVARLVERVRSAKEGRHG